LIDLGLATYFYPTSIAYTTDTHEPFVASMESSRYPFYSIQFHPEKIFKFTEGEGIVHTALSEQMNRYFAEKFVNLARMNANTFGDYMTT